MVFESVITDVLNRILGDFIENLDSKQLHLGIWGGYVKLKDLILKQSAIDELDMPFQIAYGRLGVLSLKIPWKNLYGSAVEAVIDGFYLIIVPDREIKYNPEKEEKRLLEYKQAELAKIELRKKEAEKDPTKTDDTFVEKLTIQIIKNVQIQIRNIHIRYEDKITYPGHPFAVGLSLSSLTMQTTDETWKPTVVQEIVKKFYKDVQLEALAVYWNCDAPCYSNLPAEEIVKHLIAETATKQLNPQNYEYILGPINSSVRLKLNPKPETDTPAFSLPKVYLNMEMERLSIALNRCQYKTIVCLSESIDLMLKAAPYRKYRPDVPTYKGHYKEWWKFAYNCVVEEQIRRKKKNWDWNHIKKYRDMCRKYENVYQTKLKTTKFSKELKEQLDECEKILHLRDLVIIRQKVEMEMEKFKKLQDQAKKGWLSNWWWSSKSQEETNQNDLLKQLKAAMTQEEKMRLYKAIDYQENSAPLHYPKDYVDMTGVFILRVLEVEICERGPERCKTLTSELSGVKCRVETRVAANAMCVAINVENLFANGLRRGDFLPEMISSINQQENTGLLDILFETNPLDGLCDQRLLVDARPLKLTYDAETVNKITDIFTVPTTSNLEKLSAVAENKLPSIRRMSTTGLEYIITSRTYFDIRIDISAPFIIIPYGGTYTGNEDILVINLGKVNITSVKRSTSLVDIRKMYEAGAAGEEILKQMIDKSYDRFIMSLSEIQIALANAEDNWLECFSEKCITPLHLLQPTSVEIMFSKCLVSDDPNLPRNTVKGELPSLAVTITDKRLIMLVSLLESIPFPETPESEIQPLQERVSSASIIKYVESGADLLATEIKPKKSSATGELVQLTEMDAKFVMKEISLTVGFQATTDIVENIATFKVGYIESNFIQQTFNMEVCLRIGNILVQQFLEGSTLDVISTSSSKNDAEYLLTVQYFQVNKLSPEFHTRHQSCESRLVTKFGTLNMHFNQDGLLELIRHAAYIQASIDNIKQTSGKVAQKEREQPNRYSIIKESSSYALRSVKSKSAMFIKKQTKRTKVETIKFKLIASLQEVKIYLSDKRRNITTFAINGVNVEMITKQPYTQIKAQLLAVSVLNMQAKSIYSKIVTVTSDEAINTQVVLYNLADDDYTSTNITVEATVGCLRLIYLNSFVVDILNFLNNFQTAQEMIIEASQSAAQTARQNVEDVISKSLKVAIKINIEAPKILIPMSSHDSECLLLDFGHFNLTNNFIWLDTRNELDQKAVLDKMELILQDMIIAKTNYKDEQIYLEHTMLDPVTLKLNMLRNLSCWYKEVPDFEVQLKIRTIALLLAQADYNLIMGILSKNFTEGDVPQSTKEISKVSSRPIVKPDKSESIVSTRASVIQECDVLQSSKGETYTQIRFSFIMESLVLVLFSDPKLLGFHKKNLSPHDPTYSLAQFSLEMVSIKGRILSDESMGVSMLLLNCIMKDTRPHRKSKLNILMERKHDQHEDKLSVSSASEMLTRGMLELIYNKRGTDAFVDVRIYSFYLIFSADFILQILNYLKVTQEEAPEQPLLKSQSSMKSTSKSFSKQQLPAEPFFTTNVRIEKPDIILVEHLDNINTNALILNFEMLGKIRMAGEHQVISCNLQDFQVYTCCFDPAKREDTKALVICPLTISIAGSTPDDKGLHVEVHVSDIRVRVSPLTIDLLNRVNATLISQATAQMKAKKVEEEYADIWDPKPYKDSDFWFLKAEIGQEAELYEEEMDIMPPVSKDELCVFLIQSIMITVEAGVENKTLPMLLLESKIEGSVKNWSSQMSVESVIALEMGYYNSRLALWEPLIEPDQIIQRNKMSYQPWELKVQVFMNPPRDEEILTSPSSEYEQTLEEIQLPPAPTVIEVSSKSNLEITVTKTCLEVLNNLSKAFATETESQQLKKSEELSPFMVKNDTGLTIVVILADGPFMLYRSEYFPQEVILDNGSEVHLELKEEKRDTIPNLLQELTADHKKKIARFLYIRVPDMPDLKKKKIPFERADKRYFSLDSKLSKGLVSQVTMENGVFILTLKSTVQIYNYFSIPIEVFYMTEKGNELASICTIEPENFESIPFNAVYTSTKELFFAVQNYTITSTPFIWSELTPNVVYSKLLMCKPKDTANHSEPYVIKVIGEMEQVFYESTSRRTITSVCYNIYLRPAIVLRNCLPVPIICIVDKVLEEYKVEQGAAVHLPNVNPGHSTICIRIPDYLEKEWSCKREILHYPSEFSVWQFYSYDSSVKVCLDLGMHVKRNGSLVLSLYCPFWMINNTSLTLDYRTAEDNINILTHPENLSRPLLFSFSEKNFFGKKKASIRIKDGDWSDKFSLDVAGSSGYVVCKGKEQLYWIGIRNQLMHNGLTKQVTFTPYFVLINNAHYDIECQELDRPVDPWIRINAESCSPLWPKSNKDDKLLKLRVCGTHEITPPFLYTQTNDVLLKLRNKYGGIHVDVQVTEGAVYVNLNSYGESLPPPMLINHTDKAISYWEKETVQIRKLQPKHMILYSWDNPPSYRVLSWDVGHKKEMEDDLRKDGLREYSPMEDYWVYWVSFLNGTQRVILFTLDKAIAASVQSARQFEAVDQEMTISIYGIGLSLVNNVKQREIMYMALANTGIIWEMAKLKSNRYKQMSVRDSHFVEKAYQQYLNRMYTEHPQEAKYTIDGRIEIDFDTEMMFKPHKRKIRRVFQSGLWIQMKSSTYQLQFHAKINKIQIDNQLFDSIFPVVLAPVPPPRTMTADCFYKPFVEVSVVQRLMKYSQIKQFKYFKVLIQEFHIKVDVSFIGELLEVLQYAEQSEEEEHKLFLEDVKRTEEPLLSLVSIQSLQEQKNFYDLLHFSPLKVHVSFSMQASGDKPQQLNVVNILLQGLGVTLTNMHDVVFKLAFFERAYTFLSQRQLISEATFHYSNQAIKQLYVLVLGLDVLGNPYGFVMGITIGFEDFFYEPFQGAIQGPGEFVEGLVLGTRSLFSHTLGGVAGAISKITGAMGRGVATLTFDKEYQRKRREQLKKTPASIQEGFARGGKGLVMGVVDGVTGVFSKPISGAKQEGVEGFFKGLGKGAIGLVTRPTAGIIDFTNESFDAFKRATDVQEEVGKLRPPRFLQSDGLVRPYNIKEAEGNKLLMELEKGKFSHTDRYATHYVIEKKEILLLTDKRITYVTQNEVFGGLQADWAYAWLDFKDPPELHPKGILIPIPEGKRKKLGIFGSNATSKLVIIENEQLKEEIYKKIEELRSSA